MLPSVGEDDDAQTPWITLQFVQDVLRGEDDTADVTVTGRDVELAVGKGDNFLGILYRVRVEFTQKGSDTVRTRHLIVKVLPAGEFMQKLVHEHGFFKRELQVYNVALPAMYRLQKTPGPAPLTPRVFFTSRPDTLVLEDLRPQGFVMSDRRNRLDLPHCRLVVRSLARLHGLSAVLIHRNPTWLTDLVEDMYDADNREVLSLAEVVDTWPGYERFRPKILKLIPGATERFLEVTKRTEGGFNVFNHGDCWINNALFKYSSSGDVVDVKFIDFQFSQISSPAIDLQFFLCTSPQDEVREQFWGRLLQEYHEALCSTVQELDSDVYVLSLQELLDEMQRTTFFGFIMSISSLAAILGETNNSPGIVEYKEGADPVSLFEKTQRSLAFQHSFQKLLITFEKAGIFD